MPSAVIVGAGVFGASLAHRLAGSGWSVTLVEQYTPGHVRAASGDETRLIRFSHGADGWYTASARRALELWRELETAVGRELFVPCGVAWLFGESGAWAAESAATLTAAGIEHERLDPEDAPRFFPSFDPSGLTTVLYEPRAGILRARDATMAIAEQAVARGTRLVHRRVEPDETLEADAVVWACGPWLAGMFPELELTVTRQDVFYYGVPAEWSAARVPAWIDFDERIYGVGDVDGRGFKACPDERGPELDPDGDDREAAAENAEAVRAYLTRRFPTLTGVPLVGSRACPYSLTLDENFVVARRPDRENEWILGGGSGHGFKHGPALAEYVERLLTGQEQPDPRFQIASRQPAGGLRTRN